MIQNSLVSAVPSDGNRLGRQRTRALKIAESQQSPAEIAQHACAIRAIRVAQCRGINVDLPRHLQKVTRTR